MTEEISQAPENQFSSSRLTRLADLFNEAGMLRNIMRSGFAFLGSGKESVAEHSFRTAVIGYALAKITGADAPLTVLLCLFHDLHEARTGDFNYVNHLYDTCQARRALEDSVKGTGLEKEILGFFDMLEEKDSLEARVAADADQLDLICNLQEQLVKGNHYAADWIDSALPRLKLKKSRELAETILKTDPNHWWFGTIDKSWWVNRGREK